MLIEGKGYAGMGTRVSQLFCRPCNDLGFMKRDKQKTVVCLPLDMMPPSGVACAFLVPIIHKIHN